MTSTDGPILLTQEATVLRLRSSSSFPASSPAFFVILSLRSGVMSSSLTPPRSPLSPLPMVTPTTTPTSSFQPVSGVSTFVDTAVAAESPFAIPAGARRPRSWLSPTTTITSVAAPATISVTAPATISTAGPMTATATTEKTAVSVKARKKRGPEKTTKRAPKARKPTHESDTLIDPKNDLAKGIAEALDGSVRKTRGGSRGLRTRKVSASARHREPSTLSIQLDAALESDTIPDFEHDAGETCHAIGSDDLSDDEVDDCQQQQEYDISHVVHAIESGYSEEWDCLDDMDMSDQPPPPPSATQTSAPTTSPPPRAHVRPTLETSGPSITPPPEAQRSPIIDTVVDPAAGPIPFGQKGNRMPEGPRSKTLILSYQHHIASLCGRRRSWRQG